MWIEVFLSAAIKKNLQQGNRHLCTYYLMYLRISRGCLSLREGIHAWLAPGGHPLFTLYSRDIVVRFLNSFFFHIWSLSTVRDMKVSNVKAEDQCKWFNTIWFILPKEKNSCQIRVSAITLIKNSTWSSGCSLCLRRSSSIRSEWVVSPHPSPCYPHPCWAQTAYLFPSQAGQAHPHF